LYLLLLVIELYLIIDFISVDSSSQGPEDTESNEPLSSNLTYEDDDLKLIVVKAAHLQEKRFRIEDHMFHLKLESKKPNMPLLTNILRFLHLAFLFILNNIKSFYKPEDANICFMTLKQAPMISALNTSGFLLHDQTSSTEMVDRLLSMLNQYLISHKTLQLNKTFKVYLKILSANHSSITKANKNLRRKKLKHLGQNSSSKLLKALWAIDVPQDCELFIDKCLVLSIVLGIAQHDFYSSNFKDKRFKYMQYILCKNKKYVKYAINYISEELEQLFSKNVIGRNGPYPLHETLETLADYYNCQFFVFEGSIKNSSKLYARYPKDYNCSLKPIFLYKPHNINHIIFIRNIYRYFRANGSTCLICNKYFKVSHFCQKLPSCFVCHRYLQQPNSFVNSYLERLFCDSKVNANLNIKCNLCNLKIFSESCKKQHKRLCNSVGYFGYKCDSCNKFFYRSGKQTSLDIKNLHKCGDKICKICFRKEEPNHLCQLYIEQYPKHHPKLGFIYIESALNFEPLTAILYVEIKKCQFKTHIIADPSLKLKNCFTTEILEFDYLENVKDIHDNQIKSKKVLTSKKTNDYNEIRKSIKKQDPSFNQQLLKFFFEEEAIGTTFIVADEDNLIMVIIWTIL